MFARSNVLARLIWSEFSSGNHIMWLVQKHQCDETKPFDAIHRCNIFFSTSYQSGIYLQQWEVVDRDRKARVHWQKLHMARTFFTTSPHHTSIPSPKSKQSMAANVALSAFLRLSFGMQKQFFSSARAKRETSAVRARLPKSFKNSLKRITVAPRLDPFFTEFNRYHGMHWGSVKVYCYGISLDVDCIGGEKKTLELALQFWEIGMSQMTGLAGSGNHELNVRYDGMEATAFSGNYSDCSGDECKMLSESEKIQDILRAFMKDCGVVVQGKVKKQKEGKKPRNEDKSDVDVAACPDVVDAQCMELLEAILGPSGNQVLKADTFERKWTLMKIIQKGRFCDDDAPETRSFLRRTPAAAEEHKIDIGKYES